MRLGTIAPDTAAILEAAGHHGRRSAAVAAARAALSSSGLSEPDLDLLLDRVQTDESIERALVAAVEAVVERLDAVQWDIQDQVDAGKASPATHLRAFAQARAAASVLAAANVDALTAAAEAAYEAAFATEDRDVLWTLIAAAV